MAQQYGDWKYDMTSGYWSNPNQPGSLMTDAQFQPLIKSGLISQFGGSGGVQKSSAEYRKDLYNSQGFKDYLKQKRIQSPFDINSNNPYERQQAEKWYSARLNEFEKDGGLPMRPEFKSSRDAAGNLL